MSPLFFCKFTLRKTKNDTYAKGGTTMNRSITRSRCALIIALLLSAALYGCGLPGNEGSPDDVQIEVEYPSGGEAIPEGEVEMQVVASKIAEQWEGGLARYDDLRDEYIQQSFVQEYDRSVLNWSYPVYDGYWQHGYEARIQFEGTFLEKRDREGFIVNADLNAPQLTYRRGSYSQKRAENEGYSYFAEEIRSRHPDFVGRVLKTIESDPGKEKYIRDVVAPYYGVSNGEVDKLMSLAKQEHAAYEASRSQNSLQLASPKPTTFGVSKNYPNPFMSRTQFSYTLSEPKHVKVVIYDVTGRTIAALVDEHQEAGTHQAEWDAHGMASGMYIYEVRAGDQIESRTMTLVK